MAKGTKEKQDDRLADELVYLGMVLDRQNSLAWRFLLGLVGGIGTAIGATVIVGLLFYMLSAVFTNMPWTDWMNDFFQNAGTSVQQSILNGR